MQNAKVISIYICQGYINFLCLNFEENSELIQFKTSVMDFLW